MKTYGFVSYEHTEAYAYIFPFSYVRTILYFSLRFSFQKLGGRHNIGLGPSTNLKTPNRNKVKCDFTSKYRDPTGKCNNRINPLTFGVAYTPFRR